jgi:hypothetical protein
MLHQLMEQEMKIFKSATEKLITKEIEYKLHEKVLKDIKNEEKISVFGAKRLLMLRVMKTKRKLST